VNTICSAECNIGYQLEGASTAVCTTQGNWNPSSPPKCTGKHFFIMMSRVVMGEGGAGEGFPGGFGGFGVTPLIKERDITR